MPDGCAFNVGKCNVFKTLRVIPAVYPEGMEEIHQSSSRSEAGKSHRGRGLVGQREGCKVLRLEHIPQTGAHHDSVSIEVQVRSVRAGEAYRESDLIGHCE